MIPLLSIIGAARAESPVDVSALPAPVAATLAREWLGAVARSAARDEDGYEVVLTVGGRALEVTFRPDGAWIETEEEVAAGDLPAAVRAAAIARGKVVGAEQKMTPGGHPSWDVVVRDHGKTVELHLDDHGAPLAREDEDEDEDEEKDD